ncbi:Lsr2-like DNA bridging protein [Streptomyces phage Enygma]
MQTKREYAASLGLAEMGKRGRMSKAAYAAIEAAESKGTVFADTGVVRTNKPAAVKAGAYDAKAVRAWAKANGIEINSRGRISSEILEAYGKANPDVKAEAVTGVKVTTGKDVRPHAAPTRGKSTEYVAVDRNGKTWRFSEREVCKCGYSLSHCGCGSPVVLGLDVEVKNK